jgi:hypothetical protein
MNRGISLFQQTRSLNAVHLRHRQIHDYQIRIQFGRYRDGFDSVCGFTANVKVRETFYCDADGGTGALAVINDKDVFHVGYLTQGRFLHGLADGNTWKTGLVT